MTIRVNRAHVVAALVLLAAARLEAQSPTGEPTVDSATVARAAWRRGQVALRGRDYATAAREIARAESAWPTQPTYVWGVAVTSALIGDTATVLRALGAYADFALGNDLRADTILAGYVARPQFAAVLARHDSHRAPMTRSRVVATFADSTLWPEGMDYDARTRRWYLASIGHRTVVEMGGRSPRDLWPRGMPAMGAVLAVRVGRERDVLWATTSGIPQMRGYAPADSAIAALLKVRISDGAILRRWDLAPSPRGHGLGDVAVGPSGDVYVSDSNEPVLYRLRRGGDSLERITSPLFRSLQGIAPAPDGRSVFVADYSHGILRVDLASGRAIRVHDAPRSTSLGCDGIVWDRGGIIAVQNGVAPARIVRFALDATGSRFVSAAVIDRNPAVADEPTIGTIVGRDFVYVANSQWEKRGDDGAPKPGVKLSSPVLLAVPLPSVSSTGSARVD
jgi:sugar lactone lactonase YvrE